jgi:hypothetical protein
LAHLQSVADHVRFVSCADKLHNARAIVADLRAIGVSVFDRFNAGRNGALWYYRRLADTFLELGPASLARELDLAVRQMERAAAV